MRISEEDYLKTVFDLYERLEDESTGIKASDIAKELNVTKPSVSAMIRKLVKTEYIRAEPYSKIHLTKKGMEKARTLAHNHRVIEVFLTRVLGRDISEVHREAHLLEHAFSDKSVKQLYKILKSPSESPYGKRIPRE